jgi:type II secretory pathway pseudopilin PulG
MFKKRGQVWIETVIYTLIGLTIIGILLSIVVPKINQMNDKAFILQSINGLNKIDEQISSTLVAAGNTRQIELAFKKGEYIISPQRKEIIFVLSASGLKYSEPGQTTTQGEVNVTTIERNKQYDIYLSLNYGYLNLTFDSKQENKTLSPSSIGYKLIVENNGKMDILPAGLNNLNIKLA